MKRLLLIYDTPGWACDVECKAIERAVGLYAPGVFEVERRLATSAHTPDFLAQYDVVFSTLEYHLPESEHPRSASQCSSYNYWIRKQGPPNFPEWPAALKRWKWLVAKNADIFAKLTDEDHPRRRLLYHALDEGFWAPGGDVVRPQGAPFVVGFAGHAEQPSKGVALIREAVARIDGARLSVQTWGPERLAPPAMREWYRGLDVYVCASQPGDEAGPRSPMEAGLCGVPVITTRAGQIGEMVRDGRDGYAVPRTSAGIEAAIRLLFALEPRGYTDMSREVRYNFAGWAARTNRAWAEFLVEVANG